MGARKQLEHKRKREKAFDGVKMWVSAGKIGLESSCKFSFSRGGWEGWISGASFHPKQREASEVKKIFLYWLEWITACVSDVSQVTNCGTCSLQFWISNLGHFNHKSPSRVLTSLYLMRPIAVWTLVLLLYFEMLFVSVKNFHLPKGTECHLPLQNVSSEDGRV